jgi:hypothetical protein
MAVIAVLFSLVSGAEAATVSLSGGLKATLEARDSAAWDIAKPAQSIALPTGAAWAPGALDKTVWKLPSKAFPIASKKVKDPCQNACSPFYGGVFGKPKAPSKSAKGWETTPFWTVFDPHRTADSRTAELQFTGRQSALSLLWGSPDKKNMVEFLLGGTSVGTFWGADFGWFSKDIVQGPGRGAALLTLSGIIFDTVRFTTWAKAGSFEFSNLRSVAVSTVPLPAGGMLLLAGLGGLAALRRRKAAAG